LSLNKKFKLFNKNARNLNIRAVRFISWWQN